MSDVERLEQLRRLKNTVMGAANRLTLVGEEFPPDEASTIQEVASTLAAAAERLNRLLSRIRR